MTDAADQQTAFPKRNTLARRSAAGRGAAASRRFGCPAAKMLGSDLSRFIRPGLRAAQAQQVQHFLQSEVVERHALTRKTLTGMRANGEKFLAEATITRMATADGLGAHRLGTAQLRDLRDLRDLRNRLASFTERMRSIFDLAPLAVWIIDGDRIVYANRANATLFSATDPPIGDSASIASYRILQEALINVVRHSKARQMRVALHSDAEAVVLTVQDDGVGQPALAGDQPGSHGLLDMCKRCQMPGGPFEIGNTPGGRIGVTVGLPLAAELPDHRRVRADHGHPSTPASRANAAVRGTKAIR